MDRRIEVINRGRAVLAENGPMRMTIQAWEKDTHHTDTAVAAADYAFCCLEQVASCRLELMHRNRSLLSRFDPDSARVPFMMVKSVFELDASDLTPMAAVAGSMADAVADWLMALGMSRVIVENGGDIAIRLGPNETVRVGIRKDVASAALSHILTLDSRRASWGVNTSGLGGRSLTRGIASAVTAVADTSSRADAAATAIANACFTADPAIVQVPARQVDPGSDIPDFLVTEQVGPLDPSRYAAAIRNALALAGQYVSGSNLIGAYIAAGDQEKWTAGFSRQVAEITPVK